MAQPRCLIPEKDNEQEILVKYTGEHLLAFTIYSCFNNIKLCYDQTGSTTR